MQNRESDLKHNISKSKEKTGSLNSIKKFFLNHFFYGIYGFTLFFLFSIFIDFFLSLFDPQKSFSVNLFTLLIGIAGFLLAFGFSFLDSLKK
ncbi:MAG: hypothetical protein IPM32_00900 [Ignavibacteriae bacterium]|nr:hypothetical protein [Ignavibacteriota bacterium]